MTSSCQSDIPVRQFNVLTDRFVFRSSFWVCSPWLWNTWVDYTCLIRWWGEPTVQIGCRNDTLLRNKSVFCFVLIFHVVFSVCRSTSFTFCGLYVAFVFGGQYFMRGRSKLDLRWPMALWSLSLAVFRCVSLETGAGTETPTAQRVCLHIYVCVFTF